ncbi:zinc finger protein 394 isoform X2 [Sinocyclocheilus rhinocerous]|uniref:zinc finger protein 394 isoform X2 n=1 Tax=Sinocyclocheilus rhinocerous TaxID=307959 RepID=UPI0007B7D710|nr:PREDICTED: zinc finger protein 394-like isoform X2 [Sinocyclocheilus rhinocerous]XP_016416535.1 PREDICTED: zinc finger protein 394-like isoform X2 [Sinocyclocheilus rhinocerous]
MTDTLVLSFQTRLSAVMETVLKTTMYEITRLVEESFLEQMDRGKREAEVIKRRLILSEAKLRERERFKRVRCVDCGRTAVSRRRMLHRCPESQSSLDHPLVVKQENASDSSWKCSPKGSANQEKPSATPESKQNTVQVCEPKPGGEVKEEATEARDPQARLVIHPQIHKQKDPLSGVKETNGLCNPDSDHKPGGTSCTERPGDEDEVRHRNLPKWFDPKTDPSAWSSFSQPEPVRTSVSSESPGLRPQVGSIDSGPVKQEVVVMLPPDWEDMERIRPQVVSAHNSAKKTQSDLQPGDPLTPRPHVQEQVSYPAPPIKVQSLAPQTMQHLRSPVRKNTKILLHPNSVVTDHGAVDIDRVQSICKALPATKPPHVRQYPEGAATGERNFNTVHPGRSLPQMVSMRVQGDTRHHSAKTMHNCSQCGKGFSHLCHLRAHQQIHTGERQFCCTICGRSFTKLSNLKAHRRVHTGERPYICTDCGKRFTQKCNLKRHQRIHSEFTHSNV